MTAPMANEYIFDSGVNSNGSLQLTLRADTDNGVVADGTDDETANIQILFTKELTAEWGAVQGSIGLGIPEQGFDGDGLNNNLILDAKYDNPSNDGRDGKIILRTQSVTRFSVAHDEILPSVPFKGVQVYNGNKGAGKIEFLENTDNGTNKVTLEGPDSIASDYTVELPSSAGTLATIETNAFSSTGSIPNKELTAPLSNSYVFSSGPGETTNGSCIMKIKSDTDDGSDETSNCQILFSKENAQVEGSISLGVPGVISNDFIINAKLNSNLFLQN